MTETAVILTNDSYQTTFAKTAHGLVRGPCRYQLLGVVDSSCAGQDAGQLLDGQRRGIPVFESVPAMLAQLSERPDYCVIGVATLGGVLPPELRGSLVEAAEAGISLVNGLHQLLVDDAELAEICRRQGARIIDLRRPRPSAELRFWTGEIFGLDTPCLAVLGTDCALGKRTTCSLLRQACQKIGIRAEMVYTGQTGWLHGFAHGFILDATANDFVCGELEGAILACQRETDPDLILVEGQSSLRNPSGPCGSELILAGGARQVILQHAPTRTFFDELDDLGCRIPSLAEEIQLIELLGAEVWAVALNVEGLDPEQAEQERIRLAAELQLPVVLPLIDEGQQELAQVISTRLAKGASV